MAELPGWTRDRLATALPADVAVARWIVYVRRWESLLTRDFKTELEEVDEAALKDARAIENRDRRRRALLKEALTKAWKLQASVRARLGMEPLDG